MTFAVQAFARLPAAGLAAFALALTACGGGGGNATPTPSPSPDPTPVITAAPAVIEVDFAEAERLHYEGDVEGALAIYSAAVLRGTDAEQEEGLWRIARIQAERGEYSDAESNLEVLREPEGLDADRGRESLLLLGDVEFAQGDMAEARAAFEAYLATSGPAIAYAWLYLAQIESAEGNTAGAITDIEEALVFDLPQGVSTDALFALAQAYEDSDDMAGAGATYQRIAAESTGANAAEALWRLGQVEADLGNVESAQTAYRRLIKGYPTFGRAIDALNTEEAAADPGVTTFDRAYAYFLQRLNGLATPAFQFILDSPATGVMEAAQAHYYLGILSERASLYDDALAHYDAAINGLNPGVADELRGQAMWDRATVLERLGRTEEAIAAYAAVGDVPAAARAGEATFQAGFLAFRLGRPGEATTYWQRFTEVAAGAEEQARARYWLGRALETAGLAGAGEQYAAAAAAAPADYYGLRAALLRGEAAAASSRVSTVSEWLAGFAGPEDPLARDALLEGAAWQRGLELLAAGLEERADSEFTGIMEEATGDAWRLYCVAEELDRLGLHWISTLAAQRLSFMEDGAPAALYELVYPEAYIGLVRAAAETHRFDPYLQLAMIRQESLYQPDAVSSAEALGLTQVIPGTADYIAGQLGIEDFQYTDLFRPQVSIEFGGFYLGNLLADAGGNAWLAVAGYNGGPGNVSTWSEGTGGDPDLFLESITFSETRAYVEIVMENWALYRYAYGEIAEPVLPSP